MPSGRGSGIDRQSTYPHSQGAAQFRHELQPSRLLTLERIPQHWTRPELATIHLRGLDTRLESTSNANPGWNFCPPSAARWQRRDSATDRSGHWCREIAVRSPDKPPTVFQASRLAQRFGFRGGISHKFVVDSAADYSCQSLPIRPLALAELGGVLPSPRTPRGPSPRTLRRRDHCAPSASPPRAVCVCAESIAI